MPTPEERAVLFACLNSDPLYDRMEETKAFSLVNDALALLRSSVQAAGGRTIKTIGDELMAAFPAAAQAANAAIDMQARFTRLAEAWPDGSHLTIGFAWGPVILDKDGDVFGDTVSVAAGANTGPVRKKPRTIVMDGAALQQLPPALRAGCRLIHTITPKNRPPVEFYELPW